MDQKQDPKAPTYGGFHPEPFGYQSVDSGQVQRRPVINNTQHRAYARARKNDTCTS